MGMPKRDFRADHHFDVQKVIGAADGWVEEI
jgi:hypothetical protein